MRWHIARFSLFALAAAALAACSQSRDNVAVGIGPAGYITAQAAPYARLYRPYAQMSALAYTNREFLTDGGDPHGALCPSVQLLERPARADKWADTRANHQRASWLRQLRSEGWRCMLGHIGVANCPAGRDCVGGLQYHVWLRNDCREAVIAFRGTDADDIGDWLSNYRWFLSGTRFDQYDQVRAAIGGIVDAIRRAGCRHATIIATGHSLGAGLAQHVAYANSNIAYVYAFDPSPVTAYFDIPWETREKTVERFGIDRIYEGGEVLSLPRYLVSGLFPATACRPRIRVVRFAVTAGLDRVQRHRIAQFTENLIELSHAAPAGPLPLGLNEARDCSFASAASQD